MKKTSLFALAIGAIALASCSKEIAKTEQQPVANGTPFSIFASTPDTKTAVNNDQTGVNWVAGDAMNVFHATAGSTSYANDEKFTFSGDNKFEGNISGGLSASNDWYAFYPYVDRKLSPASDSQGYTIVGCAATGQQTQNGNNDMTHLAGPNIPLYGVIKDVANGTTPSFTMEQAVSVIAINVTNNSGKNLTVNSVSFKAPQDIVGTYYINFSDPENVVFTPSGVQYVSNTASLSIENASAIANSESAVFYIAIKPFSATSGQTLTINVNGYEKEINLTKNVDFVAGKIKTINFNYDTAELIYEQTFGYDYFAVDGRLTNKTNQNTYWQVPSGSDPSIATIAGIFSNKTITSDVVVTINSATYGSGGNPSSGTFSIYNSSACKTANAVTSVQSGTLPTTSSTYTDVIYTVSDSKEIEKFYETGNLAIKITKPGKTIRLSSIKVRFSYAEGAPVNIEEPTFDVAAGTLNSAQKVHISNYDSNLLYFYTTDGTDPDCDGNLDPTGTSKAYNNSNGIEITTSCTLKAIAVDTEGNKSDVVSAAYSIVIPAATLDIPGGKYAQSQYVSISNYDDDLCYFYTLDGTTPDCDAELNATGTSVVYEDASGIAIDASCTLKVIAVDMYFNKSSVTSVSYTIGDTTPDPITLTYNNFSNTAYVSNESTFDNDNVTYGYVNVMKNGSNGTPTGWAKEQVIQCKASSTFYNKTSRKISSIRVYLAINTNSFTITYGSTSECNDGSISRPTTSSGTEDVSYTTYAKGGVTGSGTTTLNYYDFDLSAYSASYFKLVNGSSTIYIHRMIIQYAE